MRNFVLFLERARLLKNVPKFRPNRQNCGEKRFIGWQQALKQHGWERARILKTLFGVPYQLFCGVPSQLLICFFLGKENFFFQIQGSLSAHEMHNKTRQQAEKKEKQKNSLKEKTNTQKEKARTRNRNEEQERRKKEKNKRETKKEKGKKGEVQKRLKRNKGKHR